MNLLLLGGNSLHNRDWLADVERELAPLFERTYMHHYAHWQAGEGNIELGLELPRVQQAATSLDEYGVFAKSAGTLLALKGIAEGALAPKWCVFTGVPLAFGQGSGFAMDAWLAASTVPTHFLQNTNDPTAGFAELKAYLATHAKPGYQLTELPGDTHDYRDFAALKAAITSFL